MEVLSRNDSWANHELSYAKGIIESIEEPWGENQKRVLARRHIEVARTLIGDTPEVAALEKLAGRR
jgi:hypothetical protein